MNFISRDKALLWSPITIISLVFLYYCVWPALTPRLYIGYDVEQYALIFNIGALMSYMSILIGFSLKLKNDWSSWNSLFIQNNVVKLGLLLFIIGICSYIPFRGLHLNMSSEGEFVEFGREGFTSYFVNLISLFCASCTLLIVKRGVKFRLIFFVILWVSVVTYVVVGFRFRIVILLLSMMTMYYLYPFPKRINVIIISLLSIIIFLGFGVMDHARSYNNGINMNVTKELTLDDVSEGSTEAYHVRGFSILAMNKYYSSGERVYFEPLINALFMPIPRAIFPWKPNAEYLRTIQFATIQDSESGSTYMNFVESFIAFGWLGIFVNGLFIGILAKLFWVNYLNNRSSLGAILALGLFNGVSYILISRGYLAQEFSCFIYFILLPFWFSKFINKIVKYGR